MKSAELSGKNRKLAYRDEGKGVPVLLLHGFCGSSAYWDEVAPLLLPHCRLLIPDLPGHGSSEAPQEPYSIEAFADDLLDLQDQLGIAKAVWLGHSLGGYITLAAVEKYAARISGFGLIHSTAFPDDEAGKANRLKGIQSIAENGMTPFIDGLIPKLFAPEHTETMPEALQRMKEIGYNTSPEGASRALEAMRSRPDRNHVLRSTDQPVLLLAGGKDQVIKTEKTFSVEGPHITKALIESAGHMSLIEAPEQLSRELIEFIKKV